MSGIDAVMLVDKSNRGWCRLLPCSGVFHRTIASCNNNENGNEHHRTNASGSGALLLLEAVSKSPLFFRLRLGVDGKRCLPARPSPRHVVTCTSSSRTRFPRSSGTACGRLESRSRSGWACLWWPRRSRGPCSPSSLSCCPRSSPSFTSAIRMSWKGRCVRARSCVCVVSGVGF